MTHMELYVDGKDASGKWWWFALLGAVLVLGGGLGLLLGIDFIFHGVGWLTFALALGPRA